MMAEMPICFLMKSSSWLQDGLRTGRWRAVARLFGKHAAQQVQLVRARHRNEHVGVFHARFRQVVMDEPLPQMLMTS